MFGSSNRWTVNLVLLIAQLYFDLGTAAASGDGTQLFARIDAENCIKCPIEDCSTCPKHKPLCTMTPPTCDTCPKITCMPNKQQAKTSAGAIAGAVIGGFAVAAILGYIAYRTCAKNRRGRASMAATAAEKENDFGMLRSARASTHTVASIASTVRTRASNIIQIAYIPGVTNRSTPGTPAHLVPPVPPLPFQDSPVGSQFPRTPNGDIQFAPSDLRASICTTVNDGRSNRSSVATTIYGGNAVVSHPNVIRAGKAAVVQVKGGSSVATSDAGSPSSEQIPPVPALFTTAGKPIHDAVPPSPAFSIGTTFFSRVNSGRKSDCDSTTATHDPARRLVPGRSHVIDENHSITSYNNDSDSDSEIPPGHRAKSKFQSQCSSCVTDMDTGSPFSDNNSIMDALPLPTGSGMPPPGNSRIMSLDPLSGNSPKVSKRTVSPFDDSNSIERR